MKSKVASPKKQPARREGRPSQEDASQIREQILSVATPFFLAHGYGATSIEAISRQARMSKRTFYHRFNDKADLFAAVVHNLIHALRPADTSHLFEGKTLEETLLTLANIILKATLSPQALALHRIIVAEATRFPELAIILDGEGTRREAVTGIATLLEREKKAGHITISDSNFCAEQFIQMVVSVPQRRALGIGSAMTTQELRIWAEHTVDLFLQGCKLAT